MATNGPVVPETEKANPVLDTAKAKADEVNKSRTGKGTRVKVGQTRGRNPQVISYEVFDESQPETLPKDLAEFTSLAKVENESQLVSMLIDGFNAQSYSAASDPVSEYVNAAWPEDVQKNFKVAVRQLAAGANLSIEDAAGIIRPQIDKVHGKSA